MKAESVYAAIGQGMLICDEKSRIIYFNDSYSQFIDRRLEDVRGKKLIDIRAGAVAPKVIAEGKAIESLLRVENGQEYFADIYPVEENGRIVGSVSIVTFLSNAKYIKNKLVELEKQEQIMKERMTVTNGTHYTFDQMVAYSPKIIETIARAKKAAVHPVNILLQGESGCGKEVFAQSIHNESQRNDGPFVAINCAALSKTMLESELFGYENGAFTGARKGGKPGLFETARGGTIFLDEISEMDYELQAKLLRVLQENKFRRIGGLTEIDTDVRVISACNVNLLEYIEQKKFRMDLYYRLAVFPLTIPSLRERQEDIMPLVDFYLQQVQIQNKQVYHMTDGVKKLLKTYRWPGNVRELRNIIDYCALMAVDGEINYECFPPSMAAENYRHEQLQENHVTLAQRVREFEKDEILRAVNYYGDTTDGKKQAAQALGISLSSLYNKINS